ncbi:related to pif1-dna helicase involved in mitochondrial dna repair and telomere length control [Ceraceosorus bombacis]|uniref:ATP-dependent DNA helicase PIF1 n=1 Tax=Ceraceosorus bombacis TaxID=401625 RepID=A0A0P1BIQ6_9BASI|nr:related to pif1-dna helicase involved in mitochondrial dna repair and telomere length control [Ceraceosorus bombacis]
MSGLRTMKRSWSGNAEDLGESDVVFLRTSQQVSTSNPNLQPIASGSQSAKTHTPRRKSGDPLGLLPSSEIKPAAASSGVPIEWSPTPSPVRNQRTLDKVAKDLTNRMDAGREERPEAASKGTKRRKGEIKFGAARKPSNDAKRDSAIESNASQQEEASSSRFIPSIFNKSAAQLREDRKLAGVNPLHRSGSTSSDASGVREKKPKLSKVFLSKEQQMIYQLVVDEGKSVFFTGSAGTGKSVLLREIIAGLRRKFAAKQQQDCIAVTASTGIAACNIGGVTLHSFAGIGLGTDPTPVLVTKIKRNRKAAGRWLRTKVLIIDEVSMIDPALFDKLEEVARAMRKSPRSFGGIQIVVTGDFFQLPPVAKKGEATRFAFEAQKWDEAITHKVNLTQVFRQKDETFIQMLNEMRFGRMSEDTIKRFRQLDRRPQAQVGITPTDLFPMRHEVERANTGRLDALRQPSKAFRALDGGSLPETERARILDSFLAPQVVYLKVNAQVMLIKNTDDVLVNGSIGKITGFMDLSEYKSRISAGQDLTKTKKDGSVDLVKDEIAESTEFKGAIKPGAAGSVAGDRSRSTSPVKTPAPGQQFPLVNFVVPGGVRAELVIPETWKNEDSMGTVLASRTQVPLILAWAMSIHKAQGQTISCCKVDLTKTFEKGQAYVAISRATSLEGLQVVGFKPEAVKAHDRVIEWSKTLNILAPS